ncbi:uncharacterized protein LOC106175329 [Lingula anatina]|uniref:Uncharacterized protein LOC106175329 n=1 Tax=Lingula anatina TaxID=7574 RepID=A0A1S3JRU8_LINAN|nr:uncharacterized protein LOC106175329 [Lingula anatina]|eukprot:XP_013412724.1 uncharacterized protein LOC106175329 [Lingula anatina]
MWDQGDRSKLGETRVVGPTFSLHAVPAVQVNFASEEELAAIPGVGARLARALVSVRENAGNITRSVLETLCRRTFTEIELEGIDFAPNSSFQDPECDDAGPASAIKTEVSPPRSSSDWASLLKPNVDAAKPVVATSLAPPVVSAGGAPAPKPLLLTPAAFTVGRPEQGRNISQPIFSPPDSVSTASSEIGSSEGPRGPVSPVVTPRTGRARDPLRSLPKSLNYDGSSNWESFELKFTRFVQSHDWTEEERLDGLIWCLNGKALDFFRLIHTQGVVSYLALLRRMKERFGDVDTPVSAQTRFQQASQLAGESLEEWADRVMTLGCKAFTRLPDEFVSRQNVYKFCQGLWDREAGQEVCLREPASIQDAIRLVRKFQQVHAAFGEKRDKKRLLVRNDEQEPRVCAAAAPSASAPTSLDFTKALKELEERLTKSLQSGNGRRYPARNRTMACYNCGEVGHFRNNCPKKALNKNGSGK